jgi:hypothetical protein
MYNLKRTGEGEEKEEERKRRENKKITTQYSYFATSDKRI